FSSARKRVEKTMNHFINICPSGGLPHLGDRKHEAIPTRLLRFEVTPARPRQRIELGATARLVRLPARGDPPLLLDAVERRVERPLFDMEHLVRQLADALDDAIAVQRA